MQGDMTKGHIPSHLIRFSIPMILGNMIQLSYNALDSIIVGRFVGKNALAAVGTSNPIMTIFILGVSGICIGASVLMGEFFGAKNFKKLRQQVTTTLIFGVFFSLIVLAFGFFLAPQILQLLQVPTVILPDAILYLRVIFFGFPFTFLYNTLAAALRSIGDSKTPVYFLAFASILNAGLDVIFIAYLNMGVFGAGLATVIAEGSAALFCFIHIYRNVPILKVKKSELKIDTALLKLTIRYGSITALQQATQPIGKLLIQGKMNTLGVDVIAVFNAVSRIDDFALTPAQSIANGITVFLAQNKGAKKILRLQKGFRTGVIMEIIYWIFICISVTLFQKPIMELFVGSKNQHLVEIGISYLTLMAFIYLIPAFTNALQGYFRGISHMRTTLMGTLIQIVVRVIFVYILIPKIGLQGMAFANLIGWIFMLLFQLSVYRIFKNQLIK